MAITVTADGRMLTPYIIHKLKKVPSAAIHPDLAIAANKNGWMNKEQLSDWYSKVITPYIAEFGEATTTS